MVECTGSEPPREPAIEAMLARRREQTRAARETYSRSFLAAVDPTGTLPDAERARLARNARAEHMRALAARSARVRRERRLNRLREAARSDTRDSQ